MLKKFKNLLINPHYYIWKAVTNINPNIYFERTSKFAKKFGINDIYLILSFDCDTQKDIDVLEILNNKLSKIGIKPVYAIPGELILSNINTLKKIKDQGAEFINHGFKTHTLFIKEKNLNKSIFFYDELNKSTIKKDIEKGDFAIKEALKIDPKGFRTPHFGTFQSKSQRTFLYDILRNLNYEFSTSTSPDKSFFQGPIHINSGLYEIPVSGCGYKPFNILDSWYFSCPKPSKTSKDYYLEAEKVTTFVKDKGIGILNYYTDPSHIVHNKNFWDALNLWKEIARPLTYTELTKIIKKSS